MAVWLCPMLSGEDGGVSSSFLVDSALSLPLLDWKLVVEGLVSFGAGSATRRLLPERDKDSDKTLLACSLCGSASPCMGFRLCLRRRRNDSRFLLRAWSPARSSCEMQAFGERSASG
ncbi:hypothetical protein Trco_000827 [Trichoderma cornu-damae]|uniref:Uncharacterized protein n=1 Tax=Trichoderma cornu-damae TaxID=654480 RepID=A0A9P8U084_9HYPO|nr:hypothetical protein Trco_000827 [Trichoderma cornu-damae]